VPIGTFVPNMLLGAAIGRSLGTLFGQAVGGLSSPGLYALCGAAAMLGGFTRVSLTVTVLLIEATGDVASTLPLFLAALAGHGAAACIAEPYDDVLLHMRKVPHIGDRPPDTTAGLRAGDLCARTPGLPASCGRRAVEACLDAAARDAYVVVVDGDGRHVGVASTEALRRRVGAAAPPKRGDVSAVLSTARKRLVFTIDSPARSRTTRASPSPPASCSFSGESSSGLALQPWRKTRATSVFRPTPFAHVTLEPQPALSGASAASRRLSIGSMPSIPTPAIQGPPVAQPESMRCRPRRTSQ